MAISDLFKRKENAIVVFDNLERVQPKTGETFFLKIPEKIFYENKQFVQNVAKILHDLFPKNKSCVIPDDIIIETIPQKFDAIVIKTNPANFENMRNVAEKLWPNKKIICIDPNSKIEFMQYGLEK